MKFMTKLETIIMNRTGCNRETANLVANDILTEVDNAERSHPKDKMRRYVIDGTYWSAGDKIYIDTQNDDDGYTVVCLNDLIKDRIKENSKATIVIDIEK